jgi:RNA polymerase sigma-70 factor (ECF subfamily)
LAVDPRSDEELLRTFVEEGGDAFGELMRRHEDRIFALAQRMCGDRADALDATQEAFIRAFRQAPKFRGDSSFGTWLYRIAVNCCNDLLRSRVRRPLQEEDPAGSFLQPSPSFEDRVAARLDVREALARLNEEYREAVAMHDLGGIPYEEIARLTGVSIGTVKSRISRGRKRLGELLEQPGRAATSKGET